MLFCNGLMRVPEIVPRDRSGLKKFLPVMCRCCFQLHGQARSHPPQREFWQETKKGCQASVLPGFQYTMDEVRKQG